MRAAYALPAPGVPPVVADGAGPPRWWWQPFAPPAPWDGRPVREDLPRLQDERLGQTAEVLRERTALVASVSDEVRQLQLALKAAGFDPGPIDGIWGPRTQAALQAYQAATGRQSPTAPLALPVRSTAVPTAAAVVGLPGGATWWWLGGLAALGVVLVLAMPAGGGSGPRRRHAPRRRH